MPWKRVKGGYTKRTKRGRGGFIKNPKQYEKLKKKGFSKRASAAITNSMNNKRKRRK
jgi:hypothetical protein